MKSVQHIVWFSAASDQEFRLRKKVEYNMPYRSLQLTVAEKKHQTQQQQKIITQSLEKQTRGC